MGESKSFLTLRASLSLFLQKSNHGVGIKKPKHVPKVVLGKSVLSAVTGDMEKTVLPRWVDRAPAAVGQKKQGKLSADQWRSLCSIHLVITLIRLWGHLPPESRWHRMLANFLDLVLAVELGSLMTTSPRHISVYEKVITRYLVTLKELYKEVNIVPNFHLALHVPDFLRLWGPSPQLRGFGWERLNRTLKNIKSNLQFGESQSRQNCSHAYNISRAH